MPATVPLVVLISRRRVSRLFGIGDRWRTGHGSLGSHGSQSVELVSGHGSLGSHGSQLVELVTPGTAPVPPGARTPNNPNSHTYLIHVWENNQVDTRRSYFGVDTDSDAKFN